MLTRLHTAVCRTRSLEITHDLSTISRNVAALAIAAIALALVSARPADAQPQYPHWSVIYSNPSNQEIRAGFFFDEHSGFVASRGDEGVHRTTDGGNSWTVVPLTPVPVLATGFLNIPVNDIFMTNRLQGWLTLENAAGSNLYETTDGGASWHAVNAFPLEGICVRQTSAALVVSNRNGGNHGGAVSTDGGRTFSFLPTTDSTVGMAFVDDLHGVVCGYHDKPWLRTADGGLTWQSLGTAFDPEAWGLYGVPGGKTFYSAAENNWVFGPFKDIPTSIWHSTDYGVTWSFVSNFYGRSTGHIAGVGDVILYAQMAASDRTGSAKEMYRSVDQGYTWQRVGGPYNDEDTRFIVLGCRGEVVIAFDQHGNVYKTIDGGDGAFPQTNLPTYSTLKVDSINVCTPRDTLVTIRNLGCDTIYITNATVPAMPRMDVLDPTGALPNYPDTILPNQSGSVRLRLYPGFAGQFQSQVIIQLLREGVYTYDTVVVTSAIRFTNPVTASPKPLSFDGTALCDQRDSEIVLANDSCFTVQIISSQIKSGANFSLVTPIANDSLPTGGRKTFTVRFSPTALGVSTDSLIVNLNVLGRPVRMAYGLTGTGKPDNPRFVMSLGNKIDFGTMTTCDKDSLIAFYMTNPGCTYLQVQLALVDSTKKNTPPPSLFKWFVPGGLRKIHNGDTLIAGIEAIPAFRGTYTGYLRVIDSIDGQPSVTTYIPFTVNITEGSKVLSLDNSTRDFDTITFCEQKSATIPLQNIGCDTLFFDSLSLSGAGFSLSSPPSVPFMLLPNDLKPITVNFTPPTPGAFSATLALRSDADSAKIRMVNFRVFATPTDTVKISAIATKIAVGPGDTSTISIMPQQTLHNQKITSVDMTLEYNSDVMIPYGNPVAGAANAIATLPGSFVTGKLPIHIASPNLPLDSMKPIVSQQFIFYLSDSARTGFRVSNFQFNGGDSIFNTCTLGEAMDSGTIDLTFACGDSEIYKMLLYGSDFQIDNGIEPSGYMPHPNPTTGAVQIPFRALREADVKLTVTNETGQEVISNMVHVAQAGETSFDLNTAPYTSGVYHYLIRSVDGGRGMASGEFVVMK